MLDAMILDASRIVQYVLLRCMKGRMRLRTVMNENAIIFKIYPVKRQITPNMDVEYATGYRDV
jgi:hypothetical protein